MGVSRSSSIYSKQALQGNLSCVQVAKELARPVIPSTINHHLQRIIDICWNADPNKRPQFKKIKPIIDKLEV